MWINTGDTVETNQEVLEVVKIEGLYSVASNVAIYLKNSKGEEIKMPYLSEFMRKVDSGEIKALKVKPKACYGSDSQKVA